MGSRHRVPNWKVAGTLARLLQPYYFPSSMRYLGRFNNQLRDFRESRKLSVLDISKICLVDPSVVNAWEEVTANRRCYPTLENVLDLCFATGTALEYFIESPDSDNTSQLDLPGLAITVDSELDRSLEQLGEVLTRVIPSEVEQELLRRFRKSDKQNRELILQLIAS